MGEDFDGYSLGASWEDTKLSGKPFSVWHRIALVTDKDWLEHLLPLAKLFVHNGEVKAFSTAEESAAIAWASGD